MKTLKLELKNIFCKKINLLFLVFVLGIGIVTAFFFLKGVSADKVLEDGSIQIVKGKEAIELINEYDKEIAGEITEDKLMMARDIFNNTWDSEKEKRNITKELLEIESLIGPMDSLRFPIKDKMTIVKWDDVDIPIEYARDYYSLRQDMLKKYTDDIKNQKIVEKIWKMEEKVDKPFVMGINHNVWGDSIEWLSMLIIICLILIIFVSATIFTEAKENGLYEIVARTALGQKKFHSSKLIAGTIFNALIYLLMMLSYLAIVYLALGGDGLKTSFQIDMAFSPGNLTYKKVILIQIIGGFIGSLALGSLAMLVSSKSKKSKIALTIMISSFAIYGLLAIFIRPESKLIQYIMNLSPCGISQVFFQLPFPNYIHLGLVMWLPYVMLIFGLVQLIIYDYLTVKLNR